MKSKILTVIGAVTLICFSFYYTDSAVNIIKKNDPIMKKIISVSDDYDVYPQSAVLINNNIIPGIVGERVNVEKSYSNMKRLGEFDKTLLVFEEVIPNITTIGNYDNYVIGGNKQKKEVSIIFKVTNTSYIEEILAILSGKSINATFFLDDNIFVNSEDLIKLILLQNQRIESLGKNDKYDVDVISYHKMKLESYGNYSLSYCYLEQSNSDTLNTCKKKSLHTIIPSIITSDFPYYDVKNKLENGSIIKLDNNGETIRELSSIINYILQKGYKIVDLEELLSE